MESQGETVWDGQVEVFDVVRPSNSAGAYAWAHETDEGTTSRYLAVLHEPPVNSPEAAVRAAIAVSFTGPTLSCTTRPRLCRDWDSQKHGDEHFGTI